MRLIDTTTLELKEFMSEEGLNYAILSHRWEDEEESFKDMKKLERAKGKRGFKKIVDFCTLAARDGHNYAWVDTCCIDKRSSAELSEAINSMFRWYQNADMCYVYLADVGHSRLKPFGKSSWFKRGWTLQELLAPARIEFYDCEWNLLGDRCYLAFGISQATKIEYWVIRNYGFWRRCSIGQRMSWASERTTTRPEDAAYSLLGIFNINMPLLYGEGEKAFIRLQKEIIKNSHDRSIFVWNAPDDTRSGLFARSPSWFNNFPSQIWESSKSLSPQYMMTNYGLSIELVLWPYDNYLYIASLHSDLHKEVFMFILAKMYGTNPPVYLRTCSSTLPWFLHSGLSNLKYIPLAANGEFSFRPSIVRTVYVNQVAPTRGWTRDELVPAPMCFRLATMSTEFRFRGHASTGIWDSTKGTLTPGPGQIGTTGVIGLALQKPSWDEQEVVYPRTMLLGFDFDFVPVCVIDMYDSFQTISPQTSSESYSFDDVRAHPDDISVTSMDKITCFEAKGWSEMYEKRAKQVPDRQGLWALKGNLSDEGLSVWLDQSQWHLNMVVSRDLGTLVYLHWCTAGGHDSFSSCGCLASWLLEKEFSHQWTVMHGSRRIS